jgi:hypothetical protein
VVFKNKVINMENMPIIGIAWFNENDWDEWKKISEDVIEDNYEDWLIEALLAKSKYEKEGYIIKQVIITPDNFMKWCKKNNKKLNSSSRSKYVSELLFKSYS